MAAGVFAAVASFEEVFLGQNHEALVVPIKIYILFKLIVFH